MNSNERAHAPPVRAGFFKKTIAITIAISMALTSLMCIVLIVYQGIQKDPSMSTIGILVLGVLASVFQYLRMRKNVERDLLKKGLEEGKL